MVNKSVPEVLNAMSAQSQPLLDDHDISGIIAMSANWPDGLQLLLSSCIGDSLKEHAWLIFQFAFIWKNYEAVDILLAAGCKISRLVWEFDIINWDEETIQNLIDRITNISSRHYLDNATPEDLFHASGISVDTAKYLYDSGIWNIDYETNFSNENRAPATPLWRHAESLSGLIVWHWDPLRAIKLLHWLVEKGAKADYSHINVGSTPAHLISASLNVYFSMYRHREGRKILQEERLDDFFMRITSMDCVDKCNCACSRKGCYPVSSAVKYKSWDRHIHQLYNLRMDKFSQNPERVYDNRFSVLRGTLQLLERVVAQIHSLAIAVLRVLTFEELDIKHTCHDVMLSDFKRYEDPPVPIPMPNEEIAEFHEEDRDNIDLLESLMVDFEEKWNEHEGTLESFVFGYWVERMKEEITRRESITEEETEAIKRTGVVLETYGPELPPGFIVEYEKDVEDGEE